MPSLIPNAKFLPKPAWLEQMPRSHLSEPEASYIKIGIAILNCYRGFIFTVNQHGWSKFCLATPEHENRHYRLIDCPGLYFHGKSVCNTRKWILIPG